MPESKTLDFKGLLKCDLENLLHSTFASCVEFVFFIYRNYNWRYFRCKTYAKLVPVFSHPVLLIELLQDVLFQDSYFKMRA